MIMPVREPAADAAVRQRAQLRAGMLRAAYVVRPIVHHCHAGIDHLGAPETNATVGVLRRILLAQCENRGEIAFLRPLFHQVAARAVPDVIVRINEARQCDHRSSINDVCAWSRQVGTDSQDGAIPNMNVGSFEATQPLTHGPHVRVSDDELATAWQVSAGTRTWRDRCGCADRDGGVNQVAAGNASRRSDCTRVGSHAVPSLTPHVFARRGADYTWQSST